MNRTSIKLSAAAVVWLIPILLAAAFAGPDYALMTAVLGMVIIGGLAAAGIVASAGDGAPFSEDDLTPAGDTPEHSAAPS